MLYDKFVTDCGGAKFTFTLEAPRKVGANYIFKFGRYKGMSLFNVLLADKDYIKYLLETEKITFTKKDNDKLRSIIYGSGNLIEVPYVNSRVLRLDLHKLQPGIVTVAMLSKANEMIVAECETAIGAVYMPVQMACKPERGSKAPVNLSIQLSDSTGIPLKGHYSVSVVDYDVVRADTLRSNLVDYINNHRDGKYPLADILQHRYPSLNYPMEHQQQITGCVRGTLKSKLKNPHLLLVNPIEGYRKEFELGDSSRFSLTVDSPENMIWLLDMVQHLNN